MTTIPFQRALKVDQFPGKFAGPLEAAKRLRAWSKQLTPKQHRELAESIERGVALMRHERLH